MPKPSEEASRRTMRVKEAALTSGVCKTKLYELIGDGTLVEIEAIAVARTAASQS